MAEDGVHSRIVQARERRSARRRRLGRFAVGAVAVLVVGAAAVIVGRSVHEAGIGRLFAGSGGVPPVEAPAPGPAAPGPAAPGPVAAEPAVSGPVASEAESAASGSTASAPAVPAPAASEPAPPASSAPGPAAERAPGHGAGEDRDRDAFKARMRRFEAETEPALMATSPARWAPDALRSILEYKEKSLRAFGAGNHASALGLLQGAEDGAREALRAARERFEINLEAAVAAFETPDHPSADESIRRALLFRPDDPRALSWQARIDALPEVVPLLEAANRARAENDLRAELAALKAVTRLDPARTGAGERARFLAGEIAEREFGDSVAAGFRAVENRDLAAASRTLDKARSLFQGREEVGLLEREVRRLDRDLTLERHLEDAESFAANDDWGRAHASFLKAGAADAASAAAVNGAKLAGRILRASREVAGHLERPERLSSDNVAAAVRGLLDDAKALAPMSPRLARDAQALERALDEAGTPVPVLVLSDDRTEIAVRGVGRVGRTLEKTISLKPGLYSFEGKRAGYRSKLVEVVVKAGGSVPLEVRVVCDERV